MCAGGNEQRRDGWLGEGEGWGGGGRRLYHGMHLQVVLDLFAAFLGGILQWLPLHTAAQYTRLRNVMQRVLCAIARERLKRCVPPLSSRSSFLQGCSVRQKSKAATAAGLVTQKTAASTGSSGLAVRQAEPVHEGTIGEPVQMIRIRVCCDRARPVQVG